MEKDVVEILFTRGNSLLSQAICGVTGEPVSHVAIRIGSLIIHSNLRGVHLESAITFLNNCKVIYTVPCITREHKILNVLANSEFSCYDVGGLLFAGLALLARHYLKIPLPKVNLWQSSGAFLCTEFVSEAISVEQDAMITPYGLYLKLIGDKK